MLYKEDFQQGNLLEFIANRDAKNSCSSLPWPYLTCVLLLYLSNLLLLLTLSQVSCLLQKRINYKFLMAISVFLGIWYVYILRPIFTFNFSRDLIVFLINFLCLTLAAFSEVFTLRLQAAGKYLPLGVVTFDVSFTSFHFLFLKLDHYHSGFLVCLTFYCSCMHNKSNLITVTVNVAVWYRKTQMTGQMAFLPCFKHYGCGWFFAQLFFLSFKMMWLSMFFKLFWTKFKNWLFLFMRYLCLLV